MIVDWSAVTELILCRARDSLTRSAQPGPHEPLGDLVIDLRKALKADSSTWSYKDKPRMYAALKCLDVLLLLNDVNKKGGKHLSGDEVTWEHAGLYWALRALLDVTGNPPTAP
jgi:hypothetical protein